jgi:hypothetical protein
LIRREGASSGVKKSTRLTIRALVRAQLGSITGTTKVGKNAFQKNGRIVSIVDGDDSVLVQPLDYSYSSIREARQFEFELKGVVANYLRYGFRQPRLRFEERKEDGRSVLYCVIEAAGITTEFRPYWNEVLNGVNQLVGVEFSNEKETGKGQMTTVYDSISKIAERAKRYCDLLEEA